MLKNTATTAMLSNTPVLSLPLMILLSGCLSDTNGQPTESGNNFPLPTQFSSRAISSTDLTGKVTLTPSAGGTSNQFDLIIDGNTASGTINNLEAGEYALSITFSHSGSGTLLATASTTTTVGTGSNTATIQQSDYSYPDDDGDYYSNYSEISEGSDPSQASSIPDVAKVFVTSIYGNGDLSSWADAGGKTGLAAGDAICQARATAAQLSGTYVAWLSDSTDDAYCRIVGLSGKKGSSTCDITTLDRQQIGPWVRVDGLPVITDFTKAFSNNAILRPIRLDENGNDLASVSFDVWTGTNEEGSVIEANCNNWTSNALADSGRYGIGGGTHKVWTNEFNLSCGPSMQVHLYCFEATEKAAVTPNITVANSKTAFVSSMSGNANLANWAPVIGSGKTGLEAGDAICQSQATTAGLANASTFKAWLSDDSTSAKDRLQSDGPWIRPDGVLIANNKSALTSGLIQSSLSVDENGQYVIQRSWTGTNASGTLSANHCGNWSSSSSELIGTVGVSTVTREEWSNADVWNQNTCDNSEYHLICLEDE